MPDVRISSPTFISEVQQTVRSTQQGGYSSVFFDAAGDYLSVANNAALNMGTSDFTIEGFFYLTATPTNADIYGAVIVDKDGLAFSTWSQYSIGVDSSLRVCFHFAAVPNAGVNPPSSARTTTTVAVNSWNHFALTRSGANATLWLNGVSSATVSNVPSNLTTGSRALLVGWTDRGGAANQYNFPGYISNLRIVKGTVLYTSTFTPPTAPLTAITNISLLTCQNATFLDNSTNKFTITVNGDAKTSNFNPFPNILNFLNEGKNGSQLFSGVGGVVSTYSLVYTAAAAYTGGVLAPNGDIHFIPTSAIRGQKISSAGTVSTYSLVYTTTNAYAGGVLAPNGDINFVPYSANRGQRISASGVVSTYSLVYTTAAAYQGGVLAPNGDTHFAPLSANRGQKVSPAGVVSTYSLVYTTTNAFLGAVLALNGDIHFIPAAANRGQKVSAGGLVSTYSLVYTISSELAYQGGVLAPNGDIHFVPRSAIVGQKISAAGVVSTYSLVYTTTAAYAGGVLAPDGDIHFIPAQATVGQKISADGVVSTYSLVYTTSTGAHNGGILSPNGDINFVPYGANRGQKITLNTGVLFSKGLCSSQFLNKY